MGDRERATQALTDGLSRSANGSRGGQSQLLAAALGLRIPSRYPPHVPAEPPTTTFAPGSVIAEKYRIDRVLGSGGMATVFAATHIHLRETVAIKVLHAQVLARPGAFTRFVREAQVAMRLRSEHVARVLDIGMGPDRTPFIVMEMLHGADLASLLDEKGPFPTSDAVDYILQACEAIAEAHAAGVVHRDLKPANLFMCVGVDGRPLIKVLDFGVSKLLTPAPEDAFDTTAAGTASDEDDARSHGESAPHESAPATITVTRAFLGSPHYMAPEQIKSARDVDARADVWALGVILYELVSGTRPFTGETRNALTSAILERDPPPLARELRGIGAAVRGALAKDPAHRLPDVGAFAEAIAPLASDEGRASFDRVVRVIASQARGPRGSNSARSIVESTTRDRAITTRNTGRRRMARSAIAIVATLAVGALATTFALRRHEPKAVVPTAGCTSNRACIESHGGAPFACRAADHACVPIASEDCEPLFDSRDLTAEDTIWIGAMFPTKGPLAESFGIMNREGVEVARREIAKATASLEGAQRVPPIALVACDDSDQPMRAARHLVDDVGVPAIIGFRSGQEVLDLAGSLLVPRGVLTVASLTSSPLITRLPLPPGPRLVWRASFSIDAVADAAAAFLPGILERRAHESAAPGPTRVALVRADLATELAFGERLYEQLVFNGKSALENGHDYEELVLPRPSKEEDVARVAEQLALRQPTVVVISGEEDTARVIERTEERWPARVPRPTYVIANDSTEIVSTWMGASTERRRRVLGVTSVSDLPENARFVIRYNQMHPDAGVTRTFNPGGSYDTFYLVAYAAFAQRKAPFTGASLASSIAKLVGPGPHIATGPMGIFLAITTFDKGQSIDLHGTSSALDFDLASGEAPTDFALLCPGVVDPVRHIAAEDVESGIVYRAKEQRVEGTLRCP